MSDRISRSINESIREGLTRDAMWNGPDRGLIKSWETGRQLRTRDPALADRAQRGELPVLGWKGGVEKAIQGKKYGTFLYLAQWQGLRGEDLQIDPSNDLDLVCSRTGVTVTYTADRTKYAGGDG
ncbi:MAG: hypothetical protein EA371_08800 [Gammaproteobacteria bacterium]|nr:MAG: hypothetical protein EA371_08800 [Gammaproteobacteria bacterium]